MVKTAAVVDATCFIGLERIGRLDLLHFMLEPVLVTPTVVAEFGSRLPWMQVEAPSDLQLLSTLNLLMDAGEAASIALAAEKRTRVILDDLKARKVAQHLGVPVTGTVGLLLKAKEVGVIQALKPLLDALDANDFHISDALRAQALQMAGE